MDSSQKLQVQIFTPQKTILKDHVSLCLGAPGVEGFFEVLPGHAPFATQLEKGTVKVQGEGKVLSYKTSGGFLRVQSDVVTLLLDDAEDVR